MHSFLNAAYTFAIMMLFPLVSLTAAEATDIYVAPTGNDTNPGTQARPFASLQRAQLAVRDVRPRGRVNVYLREGVYYMPQKLVFTDADSGTPGAPVTYQAFRKEHPVVSGGVRLTLQWTPYQNGIMQARTPAGLTTDQLFVNGERQILARYPDYNANERIFNGYAADAFSKARAARWADPRGGFMHAMHAAMWGGFSWTITGKDAQGNLTYQGGWQNNRPSGPHHDYRFVENIFEELDSPGEWFLNSKINTLYYFPPTNVDLHTAVVEAVRLKHLVEFRGSEQKPVRFINLKGITFRHTARTFMENREPLLRSDWTTYRGGAVFFNGAEDCAVEDSVLDQAGGNAIFVNNYNRRLTIRGCHISKAGANGIAFVGDSAAVRNANGWNGPAANRNFSEMDLTPGPKSNNYPADCLVDDCLIHETGRVEKQTAPVQISMSQSITVRHCSLYDVPRAGINIGDGCWGGHVIEFCDIFDTVKETGDHGSFNSWARDRWWGTGGVDLNTVTLGKNRDWPRLDAAKPVILRNNRWRCDHGWDIDLDDGSTNYEIRNNLCLNGGIKNREGFYRIVENNIMVNNSFHPHVWYQNSQDVFAHNIVMEDHYQPAGGMPETPWGREMDYNLVHHAGQTIPSPAVRLQAQSHRDGHSVTADAMFVDAPRGDFRVKQGSPALTLGFKNFPMDQFGVQKPELRAMARTPEIPPLQTEPARNPGGKPSIIVAFGARVRDIRGLGDRSAFGLPDETGVLALSIPPGSPAANAGLQKNDVIVGAGSDVVKTSTGLLAVVDVSAGRPIKLQVIRGQKTISLAMTEYAFALAETGGPEFKSIPLTVPGKTAAISIASSVPTLNDPLAVLTDGKLGRTYGPVFGNGTQGAYKADLGMLRDIVQVNAWTFNQNGVRGRQRYVLYGSRSPSDPGWKLDDERLYMPIAFVDTGAGATGDFTATSVRASNGKALGSFRWLVWELLPVTENAGGENSAFQELQVLPAGR